MSTANNWACLQCQSDIELRYNPFSAWLESDTDKPFDDSNDPMTIQEISTILENCENYNIIELNKIFLNSNENIGVAMDETVSRLA